MVNKCSVVGCKSLYINNTVKVHRFPLKNKITLPFWIAITGKEPGWTPTYSSRLCGNHFIDSDYKPGHKKGVLNPTSVPTIKYRVEFPQFRKNVKTKLQKTQNNQETKKKKIKANSFSNYDDMYVDDHIEIMQHENRNNSKYQNNNDVCNRKNQCSVLTKYLINNSTSINNHTESIESRIVKSPNENHNGLFVVISQHLLKHKFQNTKEQISNSTFNKIMTLNLKKPRCTQTIYSLYFKSSEIRRILLQEESTNSFNYTDDKNTDTSGTIFCNSIE